MPKCEIIHIGDDIEVRVLVYGRTRVLDEIRTPKGVAVYVEPVTVFEPDNGDEDCVPA